MNDSVDYDPDILSREERIRKDAGPPPVSPEFEALQQMLGESYNREMLLRAEIVRLRRQK